MEVSSNIDVKLWKDICDLSTIMDMKTAEVIEYCLDLGVGVAVSVELSKRKQEKKERSKERKEQKKNIYTNKEFSLEEGSLRGETSLAYPGIDDVEDYVPGKIMWDTILKKPKGTVFEGTPEQKEKAEKKKEKEARRSKVPGRWIASADAGKLPEDDKENLLRLAKKHNFYEAASLEMFVGFVNYHVSKGSKYVDWKRVWTTWVIHQKKFSPELMGKRSDSVIRSYETKNMLEGILDGK